MKKSSYFRDKSKYDEIFNTLEQQNGKITGKLDHDTNIRKLKVLCRPCCKR